MYKFLSYVVPVKSKVEISQNLVAFLEYMNFNVHVFLLQFYSRPYIFVLVHSMNFHIIDQKYQTKILSDLSPPLILNIITGQTFACFISSLNYNSNQNNFV
jgi:hypothetical protein